MSESAGQLDLFLINLELDLYRSALYEKRGFNNISKSIVGDAVNPKDLWHGGAYYYPRISCMGVRYKKAGMSELATVTPVLTFPVSCLISYNAIIAIIIIVAM